jgi:hypothetical protein
MRTYLDRPMKLVRPKEPKPAAKAGDDDPETLAAGQEKDKDTEPRHDIALIELVKKVVVVNIKRDPATGKDLVEKQRITGEYLVYEKATGKFRVPGKGQVFLYQVEGQDNGLAPRITQEGTGAGAGTDQLPGDARVILTSAGQETLTATPVVSRVPNPLDRASGQGRARGPSPSQGKSQAQPQGKAKGKAQAKKKAAPPLVLTQVKFTKDMIGRFGTGKENDKLTTRWADFFGNIEALHGPVPDADTVLDADKLRRDTQFITSQVLRVVSEPNPRNPEIPPRYLMRAWENAYAITQDKIIQADTLTYDSQKSLFYAYGEEGRDVVIAQQAHVGQATSNLQGRAAMYNLKTGESELIEPKQMAFVDLRTGTRPPLIGPPDPNTPLQKPKRTQLRNPQGSIERKDFNGR